MLIDIVFVIVIIGAGVMALIEYRKNGKKNKIFKGEKMNRRMFLKATAVAAITTPTLLMAKKQECRWINIDEQMPPVNKEIVILKYTKIRDPGKCRNVASLNHGHIIEYRSKSAIAMKSRHTLYVDYIYNPNASYAKIGPQSYTCKVFHILNAKNTRTYWAYYNQRPTELPN